MWTPISLCCSLNSQWYKWQKLNSEQLKPKGNALAGVAGKSRSVLASSMGGSWASVMLSGFGLSSFLMSDSSGLILPSVPSTWEKKKWLPEGLGLPSAFISWPQQRSPLFPNIHIKKPHGDNQALLGLWTYPWNSQGAWGGRTESRAHHWLGRGKPRPQRSRGSIN